MKLHKVFICCLCLFLPLIARAGKNSAEPKFDGKKALTHIKEIVGLGPRYLKAEGHKKVIVYFQEQLTGKEGIWKIQSWEHAGAGGTSFLLSNLIYRINPKAKNRIIIGSHYDSRRFADKDPMQSHLPLTGANDSGSGVAVMLELGRLLEKAPLKKIGIDLIFFDGEEGEGDPKLPFFPIGSNYFVDKIHDYYPKRNPDLAIFVDMVCDSDLDLYMEKSSLDSAPEAVKAIWAIGSKLHKGIIPEPKYYMRDDHTALQQIGVKAILMIDFDFPYFHTAGDTLDKCSAKSLSAVGASIWGYLKGLEKGVYGPLPK
ncbi:MAG: M28 family peptidase [SAR324 cluster bacterium]|nr:M28 family peptidase [SAR324 cluster bacterium]